MMQSTMPKGHPAVLATSNTDRDHRQEEISTIEYMQLPIEMMTEDETEEVGRAASRALFPIGRLRLKRAQQAIDAFMTVAQRSKTKMLFESRTLSLAKPSQ